MIQIQNKTGRVKLDDQVDAYSRRELAKEMSKLFGAEAFTNPDFTNLTNATENEVDRLEIEINSPGGSVFDGMLIVNELKAMSSKGVKTVAIVNVLAASMGSVIAASCDECLIVENGKMMIHDVSAGVRGTSKDLSRMADLCEKMSNEIAGIYAKKTGKTTEECRALMLDETWLDANQCVAIGLADAIFDFSKPSGNLSDMSLLARLTNPSAPEALEQITGLQARITELETDQATATAEIETLRGEITAKDETLAANLTAIADLTGKLTTAENLVTETAQALVELQAKAEADAKTAAEVIEAAKASAKIEAIEIAAAAGIEAPLAISGNETPTSHLDTFNSLKGSEATAYYKAHSKQIAAEQRQLSKSKSN